MADVKLNFSSQWPTLQVAKVIANPETTGEVQSSPYSRRHKHGLGYPPLAISMCVANGVASYTLMDITDVDDTYVYIPSVIPSYPAVACTVVYAIDISTPYSYPHYDSAVGDVVQDTSTNPIDLRKFLLHSRAVGPMVLNVSTKTFTPGDLNMSYTSPLNYPTFSFGYIHSTPGGSYSTKNKWVGVPLQGQAYPVMPTDGYTSSLSSFNAADIDKGSIITLRNPAVITNNTVNVTL